MGKIIVPKPQHGGRIVACTGAREQIVASSAVLVDCRPQVADTPQARCGRRIGTDRCLPSDPAIKIVQKKGEDIDPKNGFEPSPRFVNER
jgi:hypothetical protein